MDSKLLQEPAATVLCHGVRAEDKVHPREEGGRGMLLTNVTFDALTSKGQGA